MSTPELNKSLFGNSLARATGASEHFVEKGGGRQKPAGYEALTFDEDRHRWVRPVDVKPPKPGKPEAKKPEGGDPDREAPKDDESPKGASKEQQKLESVLVQEDMRLGKRERRPNPHRLAHYLHALDQAAEHPEGIEAGVKEEFTEGPLQEKLLAALGGGKPKDQPEAKKPEASGAEKPKTEKPDEKPESKKPESSEKPKEKPEAKKPDEKPEEKPAPEDKMKVAHTILGQIGGNQLVAMTGAKNIIGSPNGLSFRLPKANKGINHVSITLDPGTDTYGVKFARVQGSKIHPVSDHHGIYAENLRGLFEDETGLATSMRQRFGNKSIDVDVAGVVAKNLSEIHRT